METIRIGIVGLGGNCRAKHVPGFQACGGVEIVGVCNRTAESTSRVASEFGIPKTFAGWEELVADPQIDAVLIGTWPYLHCPVTLAALDAGKHVLTEARMAMNAQQARQMAAAAEARPGLVAQIVPSPFGLRAGNVVARLLADGYIGQLREVVVLGTNDAQADPELPIHWRQVAQLSGLNMLTLGILHETLIRWVPDPVRVHAQLTVFTPQRRDPQSGATVAVGTPDSVHVMTRLPGGARGLYHLSGAIHFGPGFQIHFYGSEGTLKYLLSPKDRLLGARRGDEGFTEIDVPDDEAGGWRVEEEFIGAIRGREPVKLTDFGTGLRYMQFTEAVARSAQCGEAVDLPLDDAGSETQ
jgi:predicted dehydrogenase